MAKSMVDPIVNDGDILTASQWIAEFQNILTNSQDLINPLLGSIDLNKKNLINGNLISTDFLNSFVGGLLKQDGVIFNAQSSNPTNPGEMRALGNVMRWANASSEIRTTQVIHSRSQSVQVGSGAGEVELYNYVLPANTLGASGCAETEMLFAVQLIAANNVDIKFYIGGASWMTLSIGNGTGADAPFVFAPLRLRIMGNGSTNSQTLFAECKPMSPDNLSADVLGSSAHNVGTGVATAFDSTIDRIVQITVQFTTANANNNCLFYHAMTRLMT